MSKINNYAELVAERKRIKSHIEEHKRILNEGFEGLKDKLEPVLSLLPIIGNLKKGVTDNPILKFMASFGIDLVVGQKLLSKSNWLARFLVPTVLKRISALVIGRQKSKENGSRSLPENSQFVASSDDFVGRP